MGKTDLVESPTEEFNHLKLETGKGGIHGNHPRTVDGLTVRSAAQTVIRSTVCRSDRRSKVNSQLAENSDGSTSDGHNS
ncbi:hypothetical protein MTR67_025904 [Solanum verrucosum]|uniref:Uncharacterized protein n=1 Tax=Solanum verrucosum TaxID=315347 RepID=A0AAF0QXZ1_SOLVR|nr:hypothetical protein MTR67_025904 [Solanum verrucosum]